MEKISTIQVMIIDDNAHRRESVQMLINIQPDMCCVGLLPDATQVVEQLNQSSPDVILMDIDMPKIDGISAVKLIRSTGSQVKIIMQTVFEDEGKITQAISAGANGYILKKSEPQKLIEGIREVMAGGAPLTPTVANFLLQIIQQQPRTAPQDTPNFTSREKEVLQLMVQGQSYKMIADTLNISVFTVNAHVRNIYEKMQVKSMSEAVAMALKNKLI